LPTVRQYLRAGLVEEIHLAISAELVEIEAGVVPMTLASGKVYPAAGAAGRIPLAPARATVDPTLADQIGRGTTLAIRVHSNENARLVR
jgi:hypothetical protein